MSVNNLVGVSQEELVKQLDSFFPSLRKFQGKYLGIFFPEPSAAARHVALLCPLCLQNGIIIKENYRFQSC